MKLPFTPEQFFGLFADYNHAFWPVAAGLWIASALALAGVVRNPTRGRRAWTSLLAILWAWSALAYHATRSSSWPCETAWCGWRISIRCDSEGGNVEVSVMKYVRRVGLFAAIVACSSVGQAQRTRPYAALERASKVEFTAPADSNSPAFWRLQQGSKRLRVLNSAGAPVLSTGVDIDELQSVGPVTFNNTISGGRWIEAVVTDHRGVVYGYYHNEPQDVCPGTGKTAPRIGAARSYDGGRSWIDLGIILEAPPDSTVCETNNRYVVGGVGDCSVMLDADGKYLYVFFSAYPRQLEEQGVAVARLRWSDRDKPVGRVALWDDGVWRYPGSRDDGTLEYPAALPIFVATRSWHARGAVDAFWGPSVHWNTFLERYVMLLNHASDGEFAQEGIYLSAAESLDDPRSWTLPQRILSGGKWYPQVIGLEPGAGTDRLAGERARFFMSGVSEHIIEFKSPGDVAVPR